MITESSSNFASHADPVAQVLADPDCAWILQLAEPLVAKAAARGPQPLAGLRFAIKDNMDVAGSVTTAGCPAFAFKADASAQVVQQLLHAGAALVGKTNLDQFACGLNGTRSPFGAVPNAFNPAYVSGGSSSGSAYVVASGQVDFSSAPNGWTSTARSSLAARPWVC
ncbi:MAG: hypothetical protein HQ445_13940 [Polaromonas sp.]|nr:hypothetical protein [Polaromonas sp.]